MATKKNIAKFSKSYTFLHAKTLLIYFFNIAFPRKIVHRPIDFRSEAMSFINPLIKLPKLQ